MLEYILGGILIQSKKPAAIEHSGMSAFSMQDTEEL